MSRPRHFLFVCSFWSLALFAPISRAQLPIVTNTTSTPIPGAGHDYLNGPTETVNPANGSLSIRVPVIVPPGRGFNLPFSFAYDSDGVNYLAYNTAGYGSQFWQTPSLSTLSNPWTEGGWSDTLPTISDVLLSWTATSPPPGDAAPSASPLISQPCYALIDFVFQDASGNRPNSVNTAYSYNSLSRLTSVLHQLSGSTIDGAAYTVDNAGNRAAKTDELAGVTSNYAYDAIYELTGVTQGTTTTESYTFDPVGNRLSSLGVSPYDVNVSNELTSTQTLPILTMRTGIQPLK